MGSSDLTGLLGIVVIAGLAYVFLSNPNILKGGDNTNANADTDTETPSVTDEPGNTQGGTGVDCGKLCRLKDCKGYKKSCKNGCTYCCDSGPNSKPCGSSSGGSSSTDVSKCPNCGNNQYRYIDANGKCGCRTFGSTSGGSGCNNDVNKCPKCSGTNQYRVCKSDGKCACNTYGSTPKPAPKPSVPCSSCRGGACKGLTGNTCTACCNPKPAPSKGCNGDVNKCPQCGGYPKYRVCKSNGSCGCNTFGGLAKAYHARPNLRTKWRFSG